MKSVYIAGPMTGIEQYNFPAFDKAAKFFRNLGWTVVSPADADRDAGMHPDQLPFNHDWSQLPDACSTRQFAQRDMPLLMSCDAIAMLPGWVDSSGAMAEWGVAAWIGMPVLDANTGLPLDEEAVAEEMGLNEPENADGSVLMEAERLTNVDRQDAYGHPAEDFGRLAAMATAMMEDKLVSPLDTDEITRVKVLSEDQTRRQNP